jgi:hypothetical protein
MRFKKLIFVIAILHRAINYFTINDIYAGKRILFGTVGEKSKIVFASQLIELIQTRLNSKWETKKV